MQYSKYRLLAMPLLAMLASGVNAATLNSGTGSAELRGNIIVSLAPECSISPAVIDFGDLSDLNAANTKLLKSQSIDFGCKNIPKDSYVQLRNGVRDLGSNPRTDADGYHVNEVDFTFAGKASKALVGVKYDKNHGPDITYQSSAYSSATPEQTFGKTTDFFIDFYNIESMTRVLQESGTANGSFSINIPFEVRLESL